MKKEIAAELEGNLLRHSDTFPYMMLVAFEASGLLRFALLLLLWPVLRLLSEDLAVRAMFFVAAAGVKERELEFVGRAVLPKFFLQDLDMAAWRDFQAREKRVIATKLPLVMVEKFAVEHLHADQVLAPDLHRSGGAATGLLLRRGRPPPRREAAPRTERPSPVVFHDGRLVPRPTPLAALLVILWLPFGAILALVRILAGLVLPMSLARRLVRPLGGRLAVRGAPPARPGSLFACTHRTLMDPVALSLALGRAIPAATYSLSRLSELISPVKTVRLSRKRATDKEIIKRELSRGDLVICPEGTTCREPFLLRFSGLFAEVAEIIVPVAVNCKVEVFYATTARGCKAMDPVFFMMNPRPAYEVIFLKPLPVEETCAAGKSPAEVANAVQRLLAEALGFECTRLTRRDKYMALAGNDGTVSLGPSGFCDWFRELLLDFLPWGRKRKDPQRMRNNRSRMLD